MAGKPETSSKTVKNEKEVNIHGKDENAIEKRVNDKSKLDLLFENVGLEPKEKEVRKKVGNRHKNTHTKS